MSMKLVFLGSTRAQVLLEHRNYTIGSDAAADVVVAEGDVPAIHCELAVSAQGVQLRTPEHSSVVVNERLITGLMALRPGDTLACGAARIRLVNIAEVEQRSASSLAQDTGPQVNATMVRPVLPKFVLRGVSGEHFGHSYPLKASMLVGRSEDAELCLPLDSISRQHARLTPAGDEVLVEDLGSANGTWINGKRVTRGQARHGDEVRFDTERFQLVVPGQLGSPPSPEGTPSGRRRIMMMALSVASAVVLLLVLLQG